MKTVAIKVDCGFHMQSQNAECFFAANNLAVTRGVGIYFDQYAVTHLPTGFMIEPHIDDEMTAIEFCRKLSELYEWEKITDPQKAKRMYALRNKVREVRKELNLV